MSMVDPNNEFDGGDYEEEYDDYPYDAWQAGFNAGRHSMLPHVTFAHAFRHLFGYGLRNRLKAWLLRRPNPDDEIPF
jgi:hypothetical protein